VVMRVGRVQRWHKAAVVAGGLMVVAAGCGTTVDAVVVMAPVPVPLPTPQDGSTILPANPELDLPAVTAAPAPEIVLPAPTTTVPPAPVGPQPQAVPALAAPLTPVKPGSSGPAVAAMQARLMEIGFWVPGPTGKYDAVTAQAVMAYQKDNLMERTGVADQATVALMSIAQIRVMSKATSGDLIEVNKGKQLLYVVRDGRVLWAVNTSTGNGQRYVETNKNTGKPVSGVSITEDGLHDVYRQHENGWRNGDLGQIYRPKYFKGGAAVHGAPRIPGYPASHGCVRVTTTFMDAVWANNLMPMGSKVWVHDGSPAAVPPDLTYMDGPAPLG
jgi:peptidoglycan hydrolase-like protein with peptidoglycan-binding domain